MLFVIDRCQKSDVIKTTSEVSGVCLTWLLECLRRGTALQLTTSLGPQPG